ncbi:hypothetical protein EXU32_13055 [Janibacter limosus]|uniref:Uncharacterized protein n=1 Tax=Janibacter limosus TaxID=53458 RepID=A0A4P6MTJ4_9MICO|nr:hypothetical protein EXU32_13055 [Janibacter limosus]
MSGPAARGCAGSARGAGDGRGGPRPGRCGRPAPPGAPAARAAATRGARRGSRGSRPLTRLLGRRLEDLAYGAGVWIGALRDRSVQGLRPRIVGRRPRLRRTGCARP